MNIFLTGEVNVGKTTVIQRFLKDYSGSVGGFKTIRVQTENDEFFGVYLLDINDEGKMLTKENRVGDCFPDKSLISYKNVFDTIGVKLLSFDKYPSIIVMDELGVLEKDAVKFQDKVFECLDSDTDVIGIIKNKDRLFLNSIRNRDDVLILTVSHDNRDSMMNKLTEYLL